MPVKTGCGVVRGFTAIVLAVVLSGFTGACQSIESRVIEAGTISTADPAMGMFDPSISGRVALPEGEAAEAPPGFVSFCFRFPDQCDSPADEPRIVSLTESLKATLSRINAGVNDTLIWRSDFDHYDIREYWTIPADGVGDCEDYALMKRKLLMEEGVSANALRLAKAFLPDGDLHLVLVVATDAGDYVLDSADRDIRAWNETRLTWVERQSGADPRQWVIARGPTTPPMQMASSESPSLLP